MEVVTSIKEPCKIPAAAAGHNGLKNKKGIRLRPFFISVRYTLKIPPGKRLEHAILLNSACKLQVMCIKIIQKTKKEIQLLQSWKSLSLTLMIYNFSNSPWNKNNPHCAIL